jgi:general secretion pathway protein D
VKAATWPRSKFGPGLAPMLALAVSCLCATPARPQTTTSIPATATPAKANQTAAAPKPVSAGESKPGKATLAAKQEAEHFYLDGAKAVQQNDLHAAQKDFAKAAALNPKNRDYSVAEQIARTNLVTQLIEESDKAHVLGHPDESSAKLLEASLLDPDNPSVVEHQDAQRDDALSATSLTDADAAAVQLGGVVVLQPQSGRHSFHMHASGQQILQQVLTAYGIIPSVDSSIQISRTSFDADDVDYAQAAHMLQLATNSFFVPLDPKRVLISKDNKENRDRFQRQMLETVYLPGMTQEEAKSVGDMARQIFDAQQTNVQSNGTLTVRAPEARLAALNHTLIGLVDGRPQVDVEVRLIEIDTSHSKQIGAQLPQQFNIFNVQSEVQGIINANQSLVQQIIANGLAPAGDLEAIVAVLIASGEVTNPLLNQSFGVFGGGLTLTGVTIPATTANLALNSSDTRMLNDVHMHLEDKDPGKLVIGEKYPIETSSYSGLTSSAVSIPGISSAGLSSELAALGLGSSTSIQQPIPQVQYQDIGLNLKITPHILRSTDVILDLELKLQALAGAAVNDIPELTNREFSATLTARDGQTTAFVSDLSRQESKAISGIPGLSDLPGFQSTTYDAADVSKGTLLILITPHVLRRERMEVAGPAVLLPHHD